MLSSAYHTESTFVAFESLIHATPPYSPAGSSRCSTGSNAQIERRTCSGATPAARAARAAAMAL